ncbi:MAG: HEAT repeat domain-containing protein [Euryarchaeota archaeon]|nr:HEAT repeat domain-containing protein [Euryarchaeota archaeon]
MPDYIEEYLCQIKDNPDIRQWDTLYTHLDAKEPLLRSVRLQDERGRDERDVGDVVAQEKRLIISGASGMGKTTTLKWLTLVYAENYLEGAERLIPLYVDLGRFKRGMFYDHALMNAHEKGLEEEDFKELLNDGKLAIFLDGLDLLGGSEDFEPVSEIQNFMSGFSRCKFVLSSRPGFFEGFKSSCKVSELVELDDPKIKGYIYKYLGEGDKADTLISRIFDSRNERLEVLCKNPMMLHLVIWLQENDKIADDRAGIYRESVEGIITHYREKGKTLSSNEQLVRDVLKELAFSMQKENAVRLDYESALDVAGSCTSPERYKGVSAEQILKDCSMLGLLHKDGDEVHFGFHQSFQEYFAAVKLKEIFEYGYDISESFSHPKWEYLLIFLSEITKRPDELFDDVIGADEVSLAAKLTAHVDDHRVENLCARLLDMLDSELDLDKDTAAWDSFTYIGDRVADALVGLHGDKIIAAALTLNDMGDKRGVDTLIDALKDKDGYPPWMRSDIVDILGDIGDGRAVDVLITALKDDNPGVRIGAADALWYIEDKRAVDALINALKDDDPWVRIYAAWALMDIGVEKTVVPLIIDALKDADTLLRSEAAEAPKPICKPTHKEKLEPLVESGRENVGRVALHSIELKEQGKIKIFKGLKYLLRWDSIPGNDSDRLLKYLLNDHDANWAERAKIHKSDDKTLIISKDKNSAEIKIDERGEKATLKLSDGRTCDLNVRTKKAKSGYTTPSGVMDAEEMLADAHLGALIDRLKFVPDSITVVDYGCGKGAFLGRMKEIERELGKIHYIGVDISRGNRYLAGITAKKYDVVDKLKSCYFMDPDEFFNKDVDIDHVFFSHVIHEIFLKYLPEILYHLLSKMKAGSRITILEQIMLVEPERDFVTWSADDFDMLFSGFAESSPRPYQTGRGHELISVDLERLDTDVSLESIRKRCLEVYEHKKERALEKLRSPDLSDDEHRYQTALLANIYSQMNEYQKLIGMSERV